MNQIEKQDIINNKELKLDLDNGKLDKEEIIFLASQKEGLTKLNNDAVSLFLKDIKSANESQFERDPQLKTILNFTVTKFDSIIKRLQMSGKIDNNPATNLILKGINFNTLGLNTDFEKGFFVFKFLLAVYTNKTNSFVNNLKVKYYNKESLGSNDFDVDFIRNLHKFQSFTEKVDGKDIGRSKVDTIIGNKTTQQLFSYLGISDLLEDKGVAVDDKFKASYEAKDSYESAKQVYEAMDRIKSDPTFSLSKKIEKMLAIFKKSKEFNATSTPKYAAAVYLINYAKEILVDCNPDEKTQIDKLLSDNQIELQKYWNSKNSKNFNDTDNSKRGFKKSDNILNEIKDNEKELETNKLKVETILPFAQAWLKYSREYGVNEDRLNQMELSMQQGLKDMEYLSKYAGNDRDQKFSIAFAKIFITNQTIGLGDKILDGFNHGAGTLKKNSNIYKQYSIFRDIKNMFLKETDWTTKGIINIRASILQKFREIDKKYDSYMSILDGYQSGDAIIEEMEKYSGTDQSLINMKIEKNGNDNQNILYKEYNEDMVNNKKIFDIIANPLEANNITKNAFIELFNKFNKGEIKIKNTKVESLNPNFHVTTYVEDLVCDFGGLGDSLPFLKQLSSEEIKILVKTFEDINKQIEQQKEIAIQETKKQYNEKSSDMRSDIDFYEKQIATFPNDQDVTKWKGIVEALKTELQKDIYNNIDKIDENTILYSDGENNITIKDQLDGMKKTLFAQALENAVVLSTMEKHENAVNGLKNKKDKTGQEKIIDTYADIKGIGSYISDKTFNNIQAITKELVVQIIICAVSAGIGNLLAKGVMVGTKWALNTVKLTNTANKLGKFAELGMGPIVGTFSKINRAVRIGAMSTKAANIARATTALSRTGRMVAAGSGFHLSSTMLNNLYTGQDISAGINPLGYTEYTDEKGETQKVSNFRGYLQSIAFFGVLEVVSPGIQKLLAKAKGNSKQLTKILDDVGKQTVNKKNFVIDFAKTAKIFGISVTGEVASLMATESILSLTFDQKLPNFDAESIIHMIDMVIGLRMTHGIKLGLEAKMDKYIIKEVHKNASNSGSIEGITLEVTRDGKTYETVLNSKGEVVRTTDPMLRPGMEVKVDQYGARSEISNRAPANRNNTADYIAKNRYENGNNKTNEGIPTEVQIRIGEKVKIDHNGKYKDIIDQYKKLIQEKPQGYEKQLEILDMKLAERITLDRGKSIEYSSETEARSSFEQLSKMKEYDATLRTYKNLEGKRCVEKLSSNTIMPNIYISVKGMEGRRGVDYTGATIKSFEIPINNLKTGDQIFSEFGGTRYEFAKKENGNWEVISEGGRFEKGNEVRLNKNKDGTMTFERIGDARKMEVSEIGLKKFDSNQSEVIIKDIVDQKQIENFVENFDIQIMSDKGITIDGKNYKMVYEPNMTQNQNRKGTWKFIVDGKVETSVQAQTKVLPENSNGNRIREKYYELRDKYVGTEIAKSGKEVKIKEQKEKEQKEKELLVKNTETFSDLNKIIEKIGEIDGVKGKKLSAEQVKDLINQAKNGYISGELVSLDFLPSQYGIKNKVEILLKNQQEFIFKVDNAKSFEELYNVLKNQKIIEGSKLYGFPGMIYKQNKID